VWRIGASRSIRCVIIPRIRRQARIHRQEIGPGQARIHRQEIVLVRPGSTARKSVLVRPGSTARKSVVVRPDAWWPEAGIIALHLLPSQIRREPGT
jgi:hypothetical protein